MNCPFCHQEMYFDGYVLGDEGECEGYSCNAISCLVNMEFPRYKSVINSDKVMVQEEYCIDEFYVKVYSDCSLIYHLFSCALQDQVQIQRQLFLNPTNIRQTLDKLRLLVMFS